MTQEKSDDTLADYEREWARFKSWCELRGTEYLPAPDAAVAEYIGIELAGPPDAPTRPALSTLRRVRSAIDHFHGEAGHPPPSQQEFMRLAWHNVLELWGVRTRRGGLVVLDTVLGRELEPMILSQPDTLLGQRDRALLIIGAGAALRATELARLRVDQVDPIPGGVGVWLPEGGAAQVVAHRQELSPDRAVSAWRTATGINDGPLFRGVDRHGNVSAEPLTDVAVTFAVRRAAELAGLPNPTGYTASILRQRLKKRER